MDHLLEPMHRLPQAGALGVDGGIVHQQLVLAVGEAAEDRGDVGLRAAVLVEIMIDALAERNDPQELAGGQRLAVLARVEVLDGAAKLGQIGADASVTIDRLDRPVEEAVGRAGGLCDFLAAHRRQLVDLLAEIGAVAVERSQLVDELGDLLVELAGLLAFQRHQAGGLVDGNRLQRFGRVKLELGRGLGFGCRFAGHDLRLLPAVVALQR